MRAVASVLVLLIVGSAAFLAGRAVETHSATTASPIQPQILTAQVHVGRVRDVVIGSARVRNGETILVSAPDSVAGALPIVTRWQARVGESQAAGDVLVEVAGRPVMVLPGIFPTYRSLAVGDQGPDVEQLRAALGALGYENGVGDVFDWALAEDVFSFYMSAGYYPVGAAGQSLRDLRRWRQLVIPRGELLFVPQLPLTLQERAASVGAVADGPVGWLGPAEARLSATVSASQRERVRPGDSAAVTLTDGTRLRGTVTRAVEDSIGGALLIHTRRALPLRLRGLAGQVSILVEQSPPCSLVVPVTALREDASGNAWVRVADGDTTAEVSVRVLTSAAGQVAVEPTSGELGPGDQVELGT